MEPFLSPLQWLFLIPTVGGSVYGLLCLLAVLLFCFRARSLPSSSIFHWPAVTILKPVCGLEKHLKENLRSACLQDYPDFQVVFSVQDANDPAIPLLKELQQEYQERASVVIEPNHSCPNPKVGNLLGALAHARHEILVISDSDVRVAPDYLRHIVVPLADPTVGVVCTLYRATCVDRWFEKMELLTLSADFLPSVIFAYVTGTSKFCLGSSVAFRRTSLEEVGGLEALGAYLAEDYEIGKRLRVNGIRMVLVPYSVDLVIDLKDFSQWWDHQVLWDQKIRAARPVGFFATVVTRSVPFALLFAASRFGDTLGLAVLGAALGLRLATAGLIVGWGLKDPHGLKSLPLLPLRDIAALISWALSLMRKKVVWRGSELTLTHEGQVAQREFTS